MRRRAIVVAVLAVAAGVIALWWGRRPSQDATDATTAGSIAHATIETPQRPRAARSDAAMIAELPTSLVPLADVVPRLQELIAAGNTYAGIDLTRRLRPCTPSALRWNDGEDERARDDIESAEDDPSLDETRRTWRAQVLREQIAERASGRAACDALPAELRAHWLDPVDRAAQAGNVQAMREYASFAMGTFDSVHAVATDLDAAIELRDKARTYLIEAAERGDADSIQTLAYAYGENGGFGNAPSPFAKDLVRAYAYAYAGTLAEVPHADDLRYEMTREAALLDGRELAEAETEGRRIYERCCRR
jgi:hypothetical protein